MKKSNAPPEKWGDNKRQRKKNRIEEKGSCGDTTNTEKINVLVDVLRPPLACVIQAKVNCQSIFDFLLLVSLLVIFKFDVDRKNGFVLGSIHGNKLKTDVTHSRRAASLWWNALKEFQGVVNLRRCTENKSTRTSLSLARHKLYLI